MPTSKKITPKDYLANEATITELAREYAAGVDSSENVRGQYLRILVAHSQQELAQMGAKRVTTEIAVAAVTAAHDRIYAFVLAAITTEDIAPAEGLEDDERRRRTRERNRRSTFARTSKAALMRWVEAGGRLATLVPEDVTKDRLAVQREGPEPTIQRVARAEERFQALLAELAEEDEGAAREAAEHIVQRLNDMLRTKGPRQLTKTKRKASELAIHPH